MTPWIDRPRPIDIRHVEWSPPGGPRSVEPRQNVWLRADGRLPDDPILHTFVLTYASDMTLLDTSTRPHGGSVVRPDDLHGQPRPRHVVPPAVPGRRLAALRPGQPDATGGRGLSRGLVFTRDGTLVATVMQEGLIRRVR